MFRSVIILSPVVIKGMGLIWGSMCIAVWPPPPSIVPPLGCYRNYGSLVVSRGGSWGIGSKRVPKWSSPSQSLSWFPRPSVILACTARYLNFLITQPFRESLKRLRGLWHKSPYDAPSRQITCILGTSRTLSKSFLSGFFVWDPTRFIPLVFLPRCALIWFSHYGNRGQKAVARNLEEIFTLLPRHESPFGEFASFIFFSSLFITRVGFPSRLRMLPTLSSRLGVLPPLMHCRNPPISLCRRAFSLRRRWTSISFSPCTFSILNRNCTISAINLFILFPFISASQRASFSILIFCHKGPLQATVLVFTARSCNNPSRRCTGVRWPTSRFWKQSYSEFFRAGSLFL